MFSALFYGPKAKSIGETPAGANFNNPRKSNLPLVQDFSNYRDPSGFKYNLQTGALGVRGNAAARRVKAGPYLPRRSLALHLPDS
jgi:hypothetical protein